ncbi:hypothetical protein AJ80_05173 [Polytolypa hystricis UAMH7299]|uniref:Beta-lactamase-related domain-containing protein n=1 Tax=Polytolypa hystricis (strain UAMH7299) TaxID=1447883 RepID=A0A2B7Y6I2_POLH7|nr:hypothetical protein AJ80_05173 [Polytolypa hystricis UAMH7299]
MLTWANAVMEAEEKEVSDPQSSTVNSLENPLQQIRLARCAHRPIVLGKTGYENSYGLGWFRHMLPSRYISSIGPNISLLLDPPVINQRGPPRLAIARWGSFGGFLSTFYTFPDTRSAIIVMANCNGAKGDPTGLIAQGLCQELYNMKPRIDLEAYARLAAYNSSLVWDELVQEWVRNRVPNTRCPLLDNFTGTYVNTGLDITIRVTKIAEHDAKHEPNPELLSFSVNSLPRQSAKLRHYHYDTWTFLPNSRDDAARKGMTGFFKLPRLLLSFIRNDSGRVFHLDWDLQVGSYEGLPLKFDYPVLPIRFLRAEG